MASFIAISLPFVLWAFFVYELKRGLVNDQKTNLYGAGTKGLTNLYGWIVAWHGMTGLLCLYHSVKASFPGRYFPCTEPSPKVHLLFRSSCSLA